LSSTSFVAHELVSLFELKRPDVLRPSSTTWLLSVRPNSVFPSVVVQFLLQLLSLLLLCFLVPLLVNVRLEALGPTVWIVALQHVYQVVDVRRRQPQRFDLAQLCVAGDVRDAVPERGECCVDRLRSSSLLLVRPDPQLVSLVCSDRTHSVAREKY